MVVDTLHQIVNDFPPVQHAFGYGSGVFHQPNLYEQSAAATGSAPAASSAGPQLDFIFGVEDPQQWHAENLARHRSHYSFMGMLGPSAVTAVADRLGVGIYFNTLVPWETHMIKYGVISLAALERDLQQWDTLYCAGRLHKPVMTLREHPAVLAAQASNVLSALRVALLLLPEHFTTEEMLHTICALSYSGDLRMGVAEDAKKVQRIVQGSNAGLCDLYRGPLSTAEAEWRVVLRHGEPAGDCWVQDRSANAQAGLVSALPQTLLRHMARSVGLPNSDEQLRRLEGPWELAAALLRPGQPQPLSWHVRHAVSQVVRSSSHRQLVAGFLSAGVAKSVRYAFSKLRKAWR